MKVGKEGIHWPETFGVEMLIEKHEEKDPRQYEQVTAECAWERSSARFKQCSIAEDSLYPGWAYPWSG